MLKEELDPGTRKRVSQAGGRARARKLDRSRRTLIAQNAALARWRGKKVGGLLQDAVQES